MLRSGKNGTVRTLVPACSARSKEMYQRYASGLYRQAFLTLGDSALAVHVVRDVIADECALPPAPEFGEDDARHRLAESVFRRCQQLAADRARRDCRPAAPSMEVASCADPRGFPSEKERERSGWCSSAVSGTSRRAWCWGSARVTWRPSCARPCSGWQPLRPPWPRTAVKVRGPSADPRHESGESDADTRIRHGDHHGSGRNRARGAGSQVATGCAAVRGDDEDVTRAGRERSTMPRPMPMSHAGPRAVNGTLMPG
jgi:hypothetical protein